MRVISLFSGCGGMDLGFVQAGFQIVWAIDIFRDAAETYRRNLGDHIVVKDLRTVAVEELPEAEVVVGGFPCQGFSVANVKRSVRDKRNLLYLELLRVVREKRPLWFVAENVKGLMNLGGGAILAMILKDFADAGYRVRHAVLNAADYGVPQRRERLFFLGTRSDIGRNAVFPPPPTHAEPTAAGLFGLRPWISVGVALDKMPEPGPFASVPNHEASKYKLRFNNYLGHRLVNPNEPAPTVTARGDDRGGVVVIHHPSNRRRITAREMATIQGFPPDFVFHGTKTSAYRQIANAVPPGLALAIAREIWRLKGHAQVKSIGGSNAIRAPRR